MSRAYKCDRCGELYERYDLGIEDLVITPLKNTHNSVYYDLCKSCRKELTDWFNENKKESEVDEQSNK